MGNHILTTLYASLYMKRSANVLQSIPPLTSLLLYSSVFLGTPRKYPAPYFSFFWPPPGFRDLYALFSPIIIRAVPAADRPGHDFMGSDPGMSYLFHLKQQPAAFESE